MRTPLCLSLALALLLAACGPQQNAESPAETVAAPEASVEATTVPADTTAAGEPTPTINPTSVAIAQNFEVPIRGDQDARVRIYEFSDYLCPFCGKFARETESELLDKYGPDEVALVFWDFPLTNHGVMAVVAAEAGHCAEEVQAGDYWKMHDTLFENQTKLEEVAPDGEAAAIDMAVELGKGVGLDEASLRICLEEKRYRPIVGALQQQALQRGVELTPTMVLVSRALQPDENGQYQYDNPETALGALSVAEMDAFIQRSLSRSMGTAVPTLTPEPTQPPPTPTP